MFESSAGVGTAVAKGAGFTLGIDKYWAGPAALTAPPMLSHPEGLLQGTDPGRVCPMVAVTAG